VQVIVRIVDFDTQSLAARGFIQLMVQLNDATVDPVTVAVRNTCRRANPETRSRQEQ